jgi:hypothetical protein
MRIALAVPLAPRIQRRNKKPRICMRSVVIAAAMMGACKLAPYPRLVWTAVAKHGGMIGDVTMSVVIAVCSSRAVEAAVIGDENEQAPFYLLKNDRNS